MAIALLIIIVLTSLYLFVYRPWQVHWGATKTEVQLKLPGDDIVIAPDFYATRAISISAPPDEVWKWIVQIGSGKAGWYSIDWIDNAGKSSADKILPEFQAVVQNQFYPFTPDEKNGMWVKDFVRNRYLLWWDREDHATWLWYLMAQGENNTRLLTRLRTKYRWSGLWPLYYMIYDAGDIVMMRKCMTGIKARAEAHHKSLTSKIVA